MDSIERGLPKVVVLKELAKQTDRWPEIIEATENEKLKGEIERLYNSAKNTFVQAKSLHSDVMDELGEFNAENLEFFEAKRIFREVRGRIYDLRKSGEDPELLEKLQEEAKERLVECNKEFDEARKEVLEYVDIKWKMEEIRKNFPEFYEKTERLMGEIIKYNSRYSQPKFRNMDIGHFYKTIYLLQNLSKRMLDTINANELTEERKVLRSVEAIQMLTRDHLDLDEVAKIFYTGLRKRGVAKMDRVSEKMAGIGMRKLVRQSDFNKFDVTLTFVNEGGDVKIVWNAKGLYPTLRSNVQIENMKKQTHDFEVDLCQNEDEDALVAKVAEIVKKLEQ